MTPNTIARTCHEANRVLQGLLCEAVNPHWDECDESMRSSALVGVMAAMKGDSSPERLHESWVRDKIDNGWCWGPVKDSLLLQHPCIVPYAELPTEQKAKDALFYAIVNAMTDEGKAKR